MKKQRDQIQRKNINFIEISFFPLNKIIKYRNRNKILKDILDHIHYLQ